MNVVYFDHNSTTALKPAVLDAMLPWLSIQHGNPTSRHVYGRNAREAIEQARRQVAESVGVQSSQIVFTSGGTEANNFAIKGITAKLDPSQILVSSIEHPCISKPAQSLTRLGWTNKDIAVNQNGMVELDAFAQQLNTETGLVSVMLANNETGAIQPLSEIVRLAKKQGAFVHTDAVQGLGKLHIDFYALGVNAMTISSHKIGGPLGIGALVLDKRIDIEPFLHGGGQERGLRSGSENVAGIVGFGLACELATQNIEFYANHTHLLSTQLEQGLNALGATIFAQQAERLPNTSFFSIKNIEGETLVTALDKAGFAVASGSACSSDSAEPSHVLLAMGVSPDVARGAVRVSVGLSNTTEQVEAFLKTLAQEVKRLKNMAAIAA